MGSMNFLTGGGSPSLVLKHENLKFKHGPDINQCRAVPGRAVPGRAVPGRAVPGRAVPGRAVPVPRRAAKLVGRSVVIHPSGLCSWRREWAQRGRRRMPCCKQPMLAGRSEKRAVPTEATTEVCGRREGKWSPIN